MGQMKIAKKSTVTLLSRDEVRRREQFATDEEGRKFRKVHFPLPPGGPAVESMWVRVPDGDDHDTTSGYGLLANTPQYVALAKYGMAIYFERHDDGLYYASGIGQAADGLAYVFNPMTDDVNALQDGGDPRQPRHPHGLPDGGG